MFNKHCLCTCWCSSTINSGDRNEPPHRKKPHYLLTGHISLIPSHDLKVWLRDLLAWPCIQFLHKAPANFFSSSLEPATWPHENGNRNSISNSMSAPRGLKFAHVQNCLRCITNSWCSIGTSFVNVAYSTEGKRTMGETFSAAKVFSIVDIIDCDVIRRNL